MGRVWGGGDRLMIPCLPPRSTPSGLLFTSRPPLNLTRHASPTILTGPVELPEPLSHAFSHSQQQQQSGTQEPLVLCTTIKKLALPEQAFHWTTHRITLFVSADNGIYYLPSVSETTETKEGMQELNCRIICRGLVHHIW